MKQQFMTITFSWKILEKKKTPFEWSESVFFTNQWHGPFVCAFRSHQKMQYACATESTLRCDRMKGQLFFRKVKYCYENKKFQIFLIFPRAPRRSAPQHGACAHLVLDPRTMATFIRSPGPSRSVRVYVLIYDDDYYW